MKNRKIVVRRQFGLGLFALALCLLGGLCAGVIAVRTRAWSLLLLGLVPFLASSPVLIYHLCWSITLDPGTRTIEYRRFFVKRRYPYSQIREVTVRAHPATYSSKEYMRITFADGKGIDLFENYQNYAQAENELLRHTTVRRKI